MRVAFTAVKSCVAAAAMARGPGRPRKPSAKAAALLPQGREGGDKRTPKPSGDNFEKADADWTLESSGAPRG